MNHTGVVVYRRISILLKCPMYHFAVSISLHDNNDNLTMEGCTDIISVFAQNKFHFGHLTSFGIKTFVIFIILANCSDGLPIFPINI